MRDVLTLESVRNRSLKEVVALLEDRALDAFASNGVDYELVVSGLRTVNLMISWVALASRHRLRLQPVDFLHALAHLLFAATHWIRHRQATASYSLLHLKAMRRRQVRAHRSGHLGLRAAVLDVLESHVRHPRHEHVLIRLHVALMTRMMLHRLLS